MRVPRGPKLDGCASQVWLHTQFENGVLHFDGASDCDDRVGANRRASKARILTGCPASEVGPLMPAPRWGVGLERNICRRNGSKRPDGNDRTDSRARASAAGLNAGRAGCGRRCTSEFIWQKNEDQRVWSVFSRSPYPVKAPLERGGERFSTGLRLGLSGAGHRFGLDTNQLFVFRKLHIAQFRVAVEPMVSDGRHREWRTRKFRRLGRPYLVLSKL